MKRRWLVVLLGFTLVIGLAFTSLSIAQTDTASKKDDVEITREFDVQGKKVKVKISEENLEKMRDPEKVIKELTKDSKSDSIHIINVSDRPPSNSNKKLPEFDPNNHKHEKDENANQDTSIQHTDCSYYGLCSEHSHYTVTSTNTTSTDNRGPRRFVVSVARGAEDVLTDTVTKTEQTTVEASGTALGTTVKGSLNWGTTKTYSTTKIFSGRSPEVVLPKNSRDFYWAGMYDYGIWTAREYRYDSIGGYDTYNHSGSFREYNWYIEWSEDMQR